MGIPAGDCNYLWLLVGKYICGTRESLQIKTQNRNRKNKTKQSNERNKMKQGKRDKTKQTQSNTKQYTNWKSLQIATMR